MTALNCSQLFRCVPVALATLALTPRVARAVELTPLPTEPASSVPEARVLPPPSTFKDDTERAEVAPPRDLRAAVPQLAYAFSAYGAFPKTVGAQGYGSGLFASEQDVVLGGGATVWGSPIRRLTLIADAQRNPWGNFSPSAAVLVHLLGSATRGWSFGALGRFKVDGFAGGSNKDEIESEVELGALLSLSEAAWHLDLNTIAGRGTGDEGEMDVESRLRLGRDIASLIRIGVDGQFRARVDGPRYLPNGRTWDFALGPQLFVGSNAFYAAVTAGPSTMGLTSDAIGFSSILAIGGAG
jgi:hypothetical protein